MGVINERSTSWCVVPCPTREWAAVAHPELQADEGYERLWTEIWHIMRLDEPDPKAAWDERVAGSPSAPPPSTRFASTRSSTAAPAPSSRSGCSRRRPGWPEISRRATGCATSPTCRPRRSSRRPIRSASTGTSPRRVRSSSRTGSPSAGSGCGSRAAARSRWTPTRTPRQCARRWRRTRRRPPRRGRPGGRAGGIGPTGTAFFDTLLDENAASHIALGAAYRFSAGDEADRARLNTSAIHVDFMIGSEALEVTGVTREGDRISVMRGGDWTLPLPGTV